MCKYFARNHEKTSRERFIMSYLLSVFGVVLIVEGIPWFLSPEKTKLFLTQIHSLSNTKLRFFGLTAMIAGLVFVRVSL